MNLQTKLSRAGYVIAGGKSSRMGIDKAFLNFGGRTLLERATGLMRNVCAEVGIVGDATKFAKYGDVIEDVYPGCGPLAGIHAALLRSSAESNLMLAVDMPFVTRQLLEFLFVAANGSEATVVVPRTPAGFQPLCAVYRRDFGAAAEGSLRARKYKIDQLFPSVTLRVIDEDELTRAGFSEQMFFNVNTVDDLRTAQRSSSFPIGS